MPLEFQIEGFVDVLMAAFLSMIIGLDRERRNSAAGLRTHMLVGVGACLFTVMSLYAFGADGDRSRVASNIVTGVGFLGAGTIIRRDTNVHNLTTAASIWMTAAVGMAVGGRAWLLALMTTLLGWVILAVLRLFESRKQAEDPQTELDSPLKVPPPEEPDED
jgi:putative Mg2+ transporter-C (MgtC) family protein